MDGDGDIDAVGFPLGNTNLPESKVIIYQNDGSGIFTEVVVSTGSLFYG